MAYFQQNLLNHLKFINKWLATHGLEASLRLPGMELSIVANEREVRLTPHFLQDGRDRKMQVAPDLHGKSNGFAGWLPRCGVRWAEMSSKLAFKRRALACGLRVPACLDVAEGEEVLVKCDRPTHMEGVRGPFRVVSSGVAAVELGGAEYYERFVSGSSLRAWFWRGQPVCAELEAPAMVVGDGRNSIHTLLQRVRRNVGYRIYVEDIAECMAARAAYELDDVLPAGEQLRVDFRYGSVLKPRDMKDRDVLHTFDAALLAQVRHAGEVLFGCVPADVRMDVVFSLDAVVDGDGLAWWVDMDADPLLHPTVYPAMLGDLLGVRQAEMVA